MHHDTNSVCVLKIAGDRIIAPISTIINGLVLTDGCKLSFNTA